MKIRLKYFRRLLISLGLMGLTMFVIASINVSGLPLLALLILAFIFGYISFAFLLCAISGRPDLVLNNLFLSVLFPASLFE